MRAIFVTIGLTVAYLIADNAHSICETTDTEPHVSTLFVGKKAIWTAS